MYLAPEVTFGKPNTVQSDLFGVGSIVWETLTGERLFEGKNDVEIFKKIRACKIPPISDKRRDIPPALVAVLDVALSADPNNRYGSAIEFAAALGQVLKQAVGVDANSALAAAVREVRARKSEDASDDVSTNVAVTTPAVRTAVTTEMRPKRDSVDVEFSSADVDADPIPLTTKKTKPPT
jgi:serine/threonine-protein kinase